MPRTSTLNLGVTLACCGEYETDLKPTYQQYCAFDLYEQTCRSLAERLKYLVQQGLFGAYSGKGTELQAYVAEHHEECFDAFQLNNTAELPHVQTFWALPDNFGLLADVVFHIDDDTRIDGVNGPEFGGEWPTCNGAGYNDDTLFGAVGQEPLGGIVAAVNLAAPIQVALSGPVLFGGAVSAAATLGTACTPQGCPAAKFSYDRHAAQFGLEELSLFHESFEITNGEYSLTADRMRIELYAQAEGAKVLDPSGAFIGYEIPAGEASFVVSGIAGDTSNRFMAANATSIWVIPGARGTWQLDAFLLEYEDGNHERWTLMIEESQWR